MADIVGRFSGKEISLENIKNGIKTHLNEYFITSPVLGEEFKLDIIGEETLTADNDVTDHYVESNTAYQDQIARRPKVYTISGEVGELVWYQKDTSSQLVGQVAQRLEGVASFLPVQSRSFKQMRNKAMKAAQWVDTASNVVSRLSNFASEIKRDESGEEVSSRSITNQEQAYIRLLAYRDDVVTPLTIKTPWGILKDYVITSLKFTQPKDTKDKSIISITLKEFRTTSVATVKFDINKYQGVAGLERQPNVDNGTTPGTDVGISLEDTIVDSESGEMVKVYKSPIELDEYPESFFIEFVPQTKRLTVLGSDGLPLGADDPDGAAIYDAATQEIYDAIGRGVPLGRLL